MADGSLCVCPIVSVCGSRQVVQSIHAFQKAGHCRQEQYNYIEDPEKYACTFFSFSSTIYKHSLVKSTAVVYAAQSEIVLLAVHHIG